VTTQDNSATTSVIMALALLNSFIDLVLSNPTCWGLVLKCYELRTRQHKMLNVNALRPLKHYFLKDLMNFGQRLRTVQLRKVESS
jgi:hypothetical protein